MLPLAATGEAQSAALLAGLGAGLLLLCSGVRFFVLDLLPLLLLPLLSVDEGSALLGLLDLLLLLPPRAADGPAESPAAPSDASLPGAGCWRMILLLLLLLDWDIQAIAVEGTTLYTVPGGAAGVISAT
jgi:hypothetical protein